MVTPAMTATIPAVWIQVIAQGNHTNHRHEGDTDTGPDGVGDRQR